MMVMNNAKYLLLCCNRSSCYDLYSTGGEKTLIIYIIGLVSSYFSLAMCQYWFFPFLALAFLTVFPRIIRSFFSWG